MGGSDVPPHPIVFQKPVTSVIAEGQTIRLPRGIEVHHEIELAVLIGKEGRFIPVDAADEYILGYALALDMTARNLQTESKKNGWPWDISKGYDTFLPLSHFVPKEQIADPYSLEMELIINGTTKQRGKTGDMHYKINEMIAYISQAITLKPGDLILTGTPAGVGPVVHGDVLDSFLKTPEGDVLINTRFTAEDIIN